MTDIILMKTTEFHSYGDVETWMIAIGNNDYVKVTESDLARLGAMIDEVLNEE